MEECYGIEYLEKRKEEFYGAECSEQRREGHES
jgi:hypothetical protein